MKDILYSIYPKLIYTGVVVFLIIWIVIQRGKIAKLELSNSTYEYKMKELELKNKELRAAATELTEQYANSVERVNQKYAEYIKIPQDADIKKPVSVDINDSWNKLLRSITPIIEGEYQPNRHDANN